MNDLFISLPATINKANPGEMDADGNYVFEVEASNENVDLQNQKILAKALEDSEEYFLTNGVISNDHQHRTKDKNGEVITNYDNVIGEPISVYRKDKRTFVKGKLYGAVKAAKPFINLLKSASSRVKASVGGLMPSVRKNADGTETITGFMWNDLALTCSPVNSTVAPAVFAKSMNVEEFAKALSASVTSLNPAEKTGGDAMVKEDLEGKTTNVLPDFYVEEDDEEEIEKSLATVEIEIDNELPEELKDMEFEIRNCIKSGVINSKKDIKEYVEQYGYDTETTNRFTELLCNTLKQEEEIMMSFKEKMAGIFKSLGKEDEEDYIEKSETENEDDVDTRSLFDDEDINTEEDAEDKDDVKKSFSDDIAMGEEYVDITEVLKNYDARIEEKDNQIKDLQKSIVKLGELLEETMNAPEVRKSITVSTSDSVTGYVKPTSADYEEFKPMLCKAKKDGMIDLQKSVHLESVFQKEINQGIRMNDQDKNEIMAIYKKYH